MEINPKELHDAWAASEALLPKEEPASTKGRIERIRFALARLDLPHACTLAERSEDCPECGRVFLGIVRDILAGNGLPGEGPDLEPPRLR